jgi:hypothetical protein
MPSRRVLKIVSKEEYARQQQQTCHLQTAGGKRQTDPLRWSSVTRKDHQYHTAAAMINRRGYGKECTCSKDNGEEIVSSETCELQERPRQHYRF